MDELHDAPSARGAQHFAPGAGTNGIDATTAARPLLGIGV